MLNVDLSAYRHALQADCLLLVYTAVQPENRARAPGRRDACRSRSGSSRGQEDKKRAEINTREDEIDQRADGCLASSEDVTSLHFICSLVHFRTRVADKAQTCVRCCRTKRSAASPHNLCPPAHPNLRRHA